MNARTQATDGAQLGAQTRGRGWHRSGGLRLLAAGLAVWAITAGGCASARYTPSGDPLLDLRNPNLRTEQRADAAVVAWGEVTGGVRDRARTRAALKDLAWSQQTPDELRLSVLSLLMRDPDPAGTADSQRMLTLLIPSEPSQAVTALLADVAAERGWVDQTPALVRSLARDREAVALADRPELRAIAALHPSQDTRDVIYGVFLDPVASAGEDLSSIRWAERARTDAWSMLSQLDEDGSYRGALLDRGGAGGDAESRRAVKDLRRARDDLGALPDTAMELAWLSRLRGQTDDETAQKNAVWWGEASGAIGRLDARQRSGLALRHAEPIRWAARYRPEWVTMSRSDLLREIESRVGNRRTLARTADINPQRPIAKERVRDWEGQLAWGDALAILVIDDMVRAQGVPGRVFEQVEVDRRDTTTEYGGVIESVDGAPRVVLFRPRSRDRTSDNRFVASDDMLRYSDRSAAHYHQQVQRSRNARFAGPSDGDLAYARLSGRSCVVFTSVDEDTLNVDYYQPNGAVIDLGTLERAPRG